MAGGAKKKGGYKPQTHHFFYVLIMVCGWIAPPLAVLIRFGIGKDFFINIICTLCGYFPGHGHNFYCQNIRNNRNKNRTPKWAVQYGLVKVKDKRGGRHQWANRYDEMLPDSARHGYADDSSSAVASTASWDGRGPEPAARPAGRKRQQRSSNFFAPWEAEVDEDEVEGGPPPAARHDSANEAPFDPLTNEQFFESGPSSDLGANPAPTRPHKKGLLRHHNRYASSTPAVAPTPASDFNKPSSAAGSAYMDDFEAEINGARRNGHAKPVDDSQRQRPAGENDLFNHTF